MADHDDRFLDGYLQGRTDGVLETIDRARRWVDLRHADEVPEFLAWMAFPDHLT